MSMSGSLVVQVIVFMHGRPQKITLVREKYMSYEGSVSMWNSFRAENHSLEMIAHWVPDSVKME